MQVLFKKIKRQVNQEGASLLSKEEILRTLSSEKSLKRLGSDIKKQLMQRCIQLQFTMIEAGDLVIFVKTKSIFNNSF